jgi:hypothetical protein
VGHPQVQLFGSLAWSEEHKRECLCYRDSFPLPHLFPLLHLPDFLLVFLVDVEDGAVFVEGYVEGFGFFYEDVGELIFLR